MERRPRPADLSDWQRVRQYTAPVEMIEECAERRSVGDWRGACAAAGIDVWLDLSVVAAEFGRVNAERVEADLRGLAPDLLRWHLPRTLHGHSTLAAHHTALLSTVEAPLAAGSTPMLAVRLPGRIEPAASQRLRLEVVGPEAAVQRVTGVGMLRGADLPPAFWHVDHLFKLPEIYGGSSARLPRFHADGAPLTSARQEAGWTEEDPAARSELQLRWLADKLPERAWHDAGLILRRPAADAANYLMAAWASIHDARVNLPHLLTEARRLHERYQLQVCVPLRGSYDWQHIWQHLWINLDLDRPEPTAELAAVRNELTGRQMMATAVAASPPDLDLLWHGRMGLDGLHPLLRSTLFPHAAPARPPTTKDTDGWEVVRVRCRDSRWHRIQIAGGRLQLLDHDLAEEQREDAIRGLGATPAGCFAARHSWLTGAGRLPTPLRLQRNHLLRLLENGNTRAVLAALDAGFDPRVSDGEGAGLLHKLANADHTVLLPRLLAAGLDVDARTRSGLTPLHAAVLLDGPVALVRALLSVGARVDTRTLFTTPLHSADNARQAKNADPYLLSQREEVYQLILAAS
jgi:hypothetical protein